MNQSRRKFLIRALFVVCVAGTVAGGFGWALYLPLSFRVALADEQTRVFDDMRSQALAGDVAQAAGCLRYVVAYYPSGTKQVPASFLDRVVERARTRASTDIIAHLRAKTGRDFGAAPEPWIEQYATRP